MLVGRIVGKTKPESFEFEVSNIIRKMDFITVRDPEGHWVLGRVEDIVQEREKALAKVSIIGYMDKRGAVKTPRMPFKPGSFIYKADDGLIKRVLGLGTSGLYVGLLDGSENLKVFLDPKLLITKHLAVLAKSGFGKSYFMGVLLEEFMENKIPAVVIDPHGEYLTLRHLNENKDEVKYMQRFDVKPKGYKKELQIFCLEKNLTEGAKKLKFREKLSYQELLDMLPFRLSAGQLSVIYTALQDIEKGEYTIEDVKKQVMKSKGRSKWSVLPVLDSLKSSGIFDSAMYVKPSDLVKKQTLSVVNLKGVDPDLQQLLVYKLVKDLFEARKHNKIPPFLLVVEEAHNFCPERGFGEAISSKVLRTVASEGRKFGMGVAIISQRAARVDKNVLSQCSTQLFLRVTNPNDLRSIQDSVEGITRGLEGEIKKLPIGTAVVVGVIDHPLLVNIRIKRTNHGGSSVIVEKKFKKEEEGDTLFFYPKFLEEDVKKSIRKKLEQYRLVYYPLWRLNCKFKTPEGEKIDSIFIDGVSGELAFFKDNNLLRTQGLPRLLMLDIKERAVLLFLTTYGDSTFDKVSRELKLPGDKLKKILFKLGKLNLVKVEGMQIRSNIKLNFEEIIENQIPEQAVNYKYGGELLPFKIKESLTKDVLSLFSPDAFEKKRVYYPLWFLFYDDGNVDIVDAMTGEKDKYLMDEGVLDSLSL